MGEPCCDKDEFLGLHGRISNIPASNICTDESWEGDDCTFYIKGQMRESRLFAENLVMIRTIKCRLGESKIYITDEIENEGCEDAPLMVLYHMNFGFPIVSDKSNLYTHSKMVEPIDESAKKGDGKYEKFELPTNQYNHQCFLHTMPKDKGQVNVALINNKINFGIYISFKPEQLPLMNEWKMMGKQDYVVGLEPANCRIEGRVEARKNGRLEILKPGHKKIIDIEFGILENKEIISSFINLNQF